MSINGNTVNYRPKFIKICKNNESSEIFSIVNLRNGKKIDRRDFIKLSGTLLSALGISGVLKGCGGGGGGGDGGNSEPSKEKTKICVRQYYSSHLAAVNKVDFSKDGAYLASCGNDGRVKIWNTETKSISLTYSGHASDVRSIAFSPDGELIVSGSDEWVAGIGWCPTVHIWNSTNGKLISKYTSSNPGTYIRSIAFNSAGTRFAVSIDTLVLIFPISTSTKLSPVYTYKGHGSIVSDCVFSPSVDTIACSGFGTIHILDYVQDTLLTEIKTSYDSCLVYSPDGNTLFSAGNFGLNVQAWDANSGALLREYHEKVPILTNATTLTTYASTVGITISPDGATILCAYYNSIYKIDSSVFSVSGEYTGHSDFVTSMKVSPNNLYVASACNDHNIQLWQLNSENLLDTLKDTSIKDEILVDCDSGSGERTDCLCDIVCSCQSVCACDTVCDCYGRGGCYCQDVGNCICDCVSIATL